MINEFTWAEQNIIKAKEKGQFSFEYGVVPFPYGEENKDKVNYCFSDGFSILNGSDTPYSAGKLIDIILEENVKDAEADEVKIPKENAELYRDLRKKPFNSQYYDSAIEAGKALCTLVGQGTNITQAKEQIKPVYQGYIDDANVPTEDPKTFDFTPIEANFDNGIDGFLPASKENVKLKNEDGALKAEMTTNVYGESLRPLKQIQRYIQFPAGRNTKFPLSTRLRKFLMLRLQRIILE